MWNMEVELRSRITSDGVGRVRAIYAATHKAHLRPIIASPAALCIMSSNEMQNIFLWSCNYFSSQGQDRTQHTADPFLFQEGAHIL
jgi:hypothetical protein